MLWVRFPKIPTMYLMLKKREAKLFGFLFLMRFFFVLGRIFFICRSEITQMIHNEIHLSKISLRA